MKSKRIEEKEDVTQHKVYFKTFAIDVPVQLMTLDMHDTPGIFFVALEAEHFHFLMAHCIIRLYTFSLSIAGKAKEPLFCFVFFNCLLSLT